MTKFRTIFALAFALSTLLLASCSGGPKQKPTFATTGKVVEGTKPLSEVTVVLHPLIDDGSNTPKPRGKTNAEGVFTLTTYSEKDGAPAGEYRVTLEAWHTPTADSGPVNRLNAKYAKPETSGLRVTVQPEANELKPFEVKR